MEQKGKESKNSKIKRKLFAIAVTFCLCATCSPLTGGVAFAGESDAAKATMPQESNFTSMQECKAGYIPVQATRCYETEAQTEWVEQEYVTVELPKLNSANTTPIADIDTNEIRYCKSKLLEAGSKLTYIYNTVRDGINSYRSEITIDGVPSSSSVYNAVEVEMAYTLVKEDYPEFFWMGDYGYAEYKANETGATYVKSIKPQYTFSSLSSIKTAQKALENKVTAALSELYSYNDYSDYNEYDKELWVHDYIAKTTEYEESATNCHTVYGALVEGKAVCEGYTRAFQLMLNKLGIESCTITGSSDGENIDHIWNAVKIDGDWYQVDLTWDDQGTYESEISYSYFNIPTDIIEISHSMIGEENFVDIPECTASEWWYFAVNANEIAFANDLKTTNDIKNLGMQIAGQINENGYARLLVTDDPTKIKLLYMYEVSSGYDLGSLGEAVFNRLYITGAYEYAVWWYGPGGTELILWMYPAPDGEGEIYAADVWDMICQEDDKEDVVIRAYPVGTSEKDIAAMIKKEKGNKVSQDYKCVSEAALSDMGIWDETGLYLAMFSFEAIPLGEYDVAIYKPGYPIVFYDLEVGAGGITRNRALQLGSWYINSFGDVDCDWDVNAADVLILKRYIAGWEGYGEDRINATTADINGDGEIDIKDLMLLEKHIAGWTGFEDLSLYWKAS